MRKSLLLASILLFAYSSFAQINREPIFKAGFTARGILNITKKNPQPNYSFSGYNGGVLGMFFALERKYFRFEFDADFGLSHFNLNYQHPTIPSLQYDVNRNLFMRSYQFSASKKIHLPKDQKIILGIGFNITKIPLIKKNDFSTKVYSYFDDQLGHQNHRIALTGNIIQNQHAEHTGFFFQMAYHFNNYQFPFYIRLNNYFFPAETFNRKVEILSYSLADPQANIERILLGKVTHTIALTFGLELWHSKLKTKPIINTNNL